jgi:tetrahydromethanopterin S-methyltransferase subunit E
MTKKNPFKKGTLAYLFYKIDIFLNSSKVKIGRKIGFKTIGLFTIVALPFQIIFILAKLILEILWAITIGLIITSIVS